MKVGLTGATGLVGKHWIERARRAGDEVVGFTRRADQPIEGCLETRAFSETLDLSGLNAVVHLAGESVFGLWTKKKRKSILESRTLGTRAVVDAMERMPAADRPKVLVCASAIGFYGPSGDARIDEECRSGSGFLAEVVEAWEAEAFRAERLGVRVIALRIGLVMAKNGGALKMAVPVFRFGLGGNFGNGRQWISWIHIDDLVEMIQVALHDQAVSGIWNATAPEPVRNSKFTRVFGKVVRRPALAHAPAWALRLLLGDLSSVLVSGQRVVPARALQHGFRFSRGKFKAALERCV